MWIGHLRYAWPKLGSGEMSRGKIDSPCGAHGPAGKTDSKIEKQILEELEAKNAKKEKQTEGRGHGAGGATLNSKLWRPPR